MNVDVTSSRAAADRVVAACRAHRGAYHTFALAFAAFIDAGHHRRLGYAKAAEYAAHELDLEPRAVAELLRFGRRLPHLPALSRALDAGGLDWTKAREILRIATSDNEAAWVERAKNRTCRDLERDVAAAAIGGAPPAIDGPGGEASGPARRRVVFEMEAADEDRLRRALAHLRAQTDLRPGEVEDGALLAAMADAVIRRAEDAERTVQAPPEVEAPPVASTPTGERYRVVLEHCPACSTTSTQDRDVTDTVVEEANCDAEILEMRPGVDQGHVTRTVPPATRRIVLHRARGACEVPGCTNTLWLDVHHFTHRAAGGGHALGNLGAICSVHHRALHSGYLSVERLAGGAVRVVHADGRARTGPVPRSATTLRVIYETAPFTRSPTFPPT